MERITSQVSRKQRGIEQLSENLVCSDPKEKSCAMDKDKAGAKMEEEKEGNRQTKTPPSHTVA